MYSTFSGMLLFHCVLLFYNSLSNIDFIYAANEWQNQAVQPMSFYMNDIIKFFCTFYYKSMMSKTMYWSPLQPFCYSVIYDKVPRSASPIFTSRVSSHDNYKNELWGSMTRLFVYERWVCITTLIILLVFSLCRMLTRDRISEVDTWSNGAKWLRRNWSWAYASLPFDRYHSRFYVPRNHCSDRNTMSLA